MILLPVRGPRQAPGPVYPAEEELSAGGRNHSRRALRRAEQRRDRPGPTV